MKCKPKTRSKTSHSGHTFSSKDKLWEGTLPTKWDVTEWLLNEDSCSSSNWCWACKALNLGWCLPDSWTDCCKKNYDTMAEFKTVDLCPKKKRLKLWHITKQRKFMNDAGKMFKIISHGNRQRREIEENYKLKMTQDDHFVSWR